MYKHNRHKQYKNEQPSKDDFFTPDKEPDCQAQNSTEQNSNQHPQRNEKASRPGQLLERGQHSGQEHACYSRNDQADRQ